MSGNHPDFALHTLGWKAFQDLCAVVLSEVLGQTFQVFAASRDGGRDGGFRGHWKPHGLESFSGIFTVQCKHTSRPNTHLSSSALTSELKKVPALVANGLSDVYILLTNLSVSGEAEAAITSALARLGVTHPAVYGSEWLSLQILKSQRLRSLVPRLYGLGDLSQIIDERAYNQAAALLESLRDTLATFVPTTAYRSALEALNQYGLVVLLGEPASGKSTIAATLSLHGADAWGAAALKIDHPKEFKQHWNPHDSAQLFWADDAFRATQYVRERTQDWNSMLPLMKTALSRGSRVILTSRDYIFNAAQPELKSSALPILEETEVVIRVSDLSSTEREQILYNHIKLGGQSRVFRTAIKPYLRSVASNPRFLPEVARRLGNPLFTRDLPVTGEGMRQFVEEPEGFLFDVIQGLAEAERSALVLIFASGGRLPSPVVATAEAREVVDLLGTTLAAVRTSLVALNGSLASLHTEGPSPQWMFRHPTIADAVARLLSGDPELLVLYLGRAPLSKLLTEVTIGAVELGHQKLQLSQQHLELLLPRLHAGLGDREQSRSILTFLSYRVDKDALSLVLRKTPGLVEAILPSSSYLTSVAGVNLLARLHEVGLLPEQARVAIVDAAGRLALETPDADFLTVDWLRRLFKDSEVKALMERVRDNLAIGDTILQWKSDYRLNDDDPESFFAPLRDVFEAYEEYFRRGNDDNVASSFADGTAMVDEVVAELTSEAESERPTDYDDDNGSRDYRRTADPGRDPFDDIDEG